MPGIKKTAPHTKLNWVSSIDKKRWSQDTSVFHYL